ncbi:L-seryl-tRNA(Ser) seleniumtransferase [Kribbella aluminosa]|uniref:L-seryl-tRNA(Ser) seleniumtransferase n=1 Tax=Kribbella aluminosa TaxID=416017 RepID=A0ABS4UY57_9ACTN|nr:hypothetical protein [Kribbella aluminosa]MBP2356581.1 L-seryl-tRNA(Ser) seleniumtransferase [Kribbella aluminosa]
MNPLGVRPVINANATVTVLGGSLMPPPVVQAMNEAAAQFVDLPELNQRVGERLAELTHNEAAYVTSGAAAAITLAVAACVTTESQAFPRDAEVVMFTSQRNGYDYSARLTGARIVEVGPSIRALRKALSSNPPTPTKQFPAAERGVSASLGTLAEPGAPAEIPAEPDGSAEQGVSDEAGTFSGQGVSGEVGGSGKAACVLWFAGAHYAEGALEVEEVVRCAREFGVPVIVDAAAQIPPVASLWRFTRDVGADAVIVSGGKGLRGPQASGLVLGKRWLIERLRAHTSPLHELGRGMKVGKEELMGLLAAVEWTLAQDEPAILAGYEQIVDNWIVGLQGIPGMLVERGYPSEAGQPHSRAVLRLQNRDEVLKALWDGTPRISVGTHGLPDDAIALNPQTLQPGEEHLVLEALLRVLAEADQQNAPQAAEPPGA